MKGGILLFLGCVIKDDLVTFSTRRLNMAVGNVGGFSCCQDIGAIQAKMFSRADVNGDGGIDQSEFEQGHNKIKDKLEISQEASELFAQLDADGSGRLDESEMSQAKPPQFDSGTYSSESVRQNIMSMIDTDGDGSISKTEADEMPMGPDGKSFSDIFSELDLNGDDLVDQDEQAAMREKMPPPPPREGMGMSDIGSAESTEYSTVDTLMDVLYSEEEE